MKVRLIVQVTCHCLLEENWKNEVECTGKEESRKTDFLAVGEACKVLFRPALGLKEMTFRGRSEVCVCVWGGGGGADRGRGNLVHLLERRTS